MPKHSLLISGPLDADLQEIVKGCLDSGLKVVLMSSDPAVATLRERYSDHASNYLLQTFDYKGDIRLVVKDGVLEGIADDLRRLSDEVPQFNYEQYVVEHSADKHIMITASAGTGKTSVMIDRILYLMEVSEVDPSDITMITFTNEATDQMMTRLQDAIITRFKLTKDVKFMHMLETSSRINISTIDSFSYRLLRTIGQISGYSSNLTISSNALIVNEAIAKILNECYVPGQRVRDCLGANMHDVRGMIKDFYSRLASLGIVGEEVSDMDWGTTSDKDSRNLQRILLKGISEMELYMESRRIEGDTVALSDLVLELSHALRKYEKVPDLGLKYLFIDEFQDTSDDQIRLISDVAIRTGVSLFVVGDPKQSIYRFRGADDSAFDTLKMNLKDGGIDAVGEYSLINNYRTDAHVLNDLNRKFRTWSDRGLLSRFEPLVPCMGDLQGTMRIKRIKKDDLDRSICRDLRAALNDLSEQNKKKGTLGKAVVLVRSNRQLDEIARICDSNHIPMVARRDKPLYLSDAVRDLYSMLSSYVHPDDPASLFGYLETAYAPKNISLLPDELLDCNGDTALLLDSIHGPLSETDWEYYKERFKKEPALSIIRDMLDDIPVLDNYVSRLKSEGISETNMLIVRSREYRANLDKILTILHSRFTGDGLDLPHIYQFLATSISTNRDELEEELDYSDLNVAYCMTVHKAKGLEFDTVIIPYDKRLFLDQQTEVVISSNRDAIGWMYYKDSETILHNSLFEQIKHDDLDRTAQEETRILYVAMTRAKRNLLAYTYWHDDGYSWSSLLEGGQ